MSQSQWLTLIFGLLGGGAAGAVITAIVSAYRNRVQPIGRRLEFLPLFKDTLGTSSLRAKIIVYDGQNEFKYDNLHVAQIQIVNKGNKDFDEFTFGITLSDDNMAIFMEPQSPDRHHQVIQSPPITPGKPNQEIDFCLRPFNRNDTYLLQLYVVIPHGKEHPDEIIFSTAEAVQFVDIPTISEIVALAARSTFLTVGPFSVSIGEKNPRK